MSNHAWMNYDMLCNISTLGFFKEIFCVIIFSF